MDIGFEANKRRSSSFITYLGQWFRGRQTPETIPAPPPNNPRHLPPPSQFVSLASATVHPRLAIPSIGRSNNRFIRLAAAFSPNQPRCKRAIPLRSRHFSPNPPTTDLVPTLSIATEQLCRAPPSTRPVFTENLCPGALHCRRDAPADSPLPFSTPTCYQRAALLRSPPISPILRPTACTLLTTRDPTAPLCSGPAYPAEGHRLAMFPTDSRIAATPLAGWVGFLELVTDLSSIPPTIWRKQPPSSTRSG